MNNSCNPTPAGDLPPHHADQCAAWYYYEADAANRDDFRNALTLVALSADGDSANESNLVAVKAYASYLTGTIGLYPAVWSFHPYEDLSATAYLKGAGLANGDTALVSSWIASLYGTGRPQPAIWLTEVAAQLTDPVPTYLGVPEGCNDDEADDPPPTTWVPAWTAVPGRRRSRPATSSIWPEPVRRSPDRSRACTGISSTARRATRPQGTPVSSRRVIATSAPAFAC